MENIQIIENGIPDVSAILFHSETETLNKTFCILSKWFLFI